MAKIKYDVEGVESGGKPIPTGLYFAKITSLTEGQSKSSGDDMLTCELDIVGHEDHNGRKLWDYIVFGNEAQAWKMRQFLEAVGLVKDGKETGTLDTDKIEGTTIQVRVRHQTDKEYGTQAKVGSLLPIPDEVDPDDLEEAESTSSSNGDGPADEAEPEGDGSDTGEEEEELTWKELEAYGRPDLEALIEENELEIKFTKRTKDDALREKIAEELEIEQSEDEDEGEGEEEPEDYSSWNLKDLRTELKQRGLSEKGQKPALIRKLKKDDADSGGDEPF